MIGNIVKLMMPQQVYSREIQWLTTCFLFQKQMEIIESGEFKSLFDKSKKLIDSAGSNMGQMANAITVITGFLLGRYIAEQE